MESHSQKTFSQRAPAYNSVITQSIRVDFCLWLAVNFDCCNFPDLWPTCVQDVLQVVIINVPKSVTLWHLNQSRNKVEPGGHSFICWILWGQAVTVFSIHFLSVSVHLNCSNQHCYQLRKKNSRKVRVRHKTIHFYSYNKNNKNACKPGGPPKDSLLNSQIVDIYQCNFFHLNFRYHHAQPSRLGKWK